MVFIYISIYGNGNGTITIALDWLFDFVHEALILFIGIYSFYIPSLIRFFLPNVPILSQKLSFSFFAEFGVRGDFGRGEEAIFLVYMSR